MASPSQLIQLAKSLPTPLQRFFARYPPAAIVPEGSPKTPSQESRPDPFRFYKHPVTGKWQDPVYSQRRQAELVKMAREHGVEDLLPDTRKGTEYRLAHRVEHGLRVKGTGVGQKVKGHIHERHMIAKYEAQLPMPQWTIANCDPGWSRGERPCWRCPASSSAGRGQVIVLISTSFIILTPVTGGQIWLDKVPQIEETTRDGMTCFGVPVHVPVYYYVQESLQQSQATTLRIDRSRLFLGDLCHIMNQP